jgi:UDP-N-acetylmuramate--alanine ligase
MKVHFIGIGGIGVSALAQFFLSIGHEISGSDLVSSEITENLKKRGIKIFIGKHSAKNLPKDVDLVIYSPAVKKDNPEFREAKKRDILIQSYPEALGELTKKYFTIAISGSHGKSTTTAMIALILIKAGLDPTVIVGTKLKEFGDSNCRIGKSKYLVIEADEHFASFLNYWPKMIVLTNIEREHLDYYKNLKNILATYKKYVSHLRKDGILVLNKDCGNILEVSRKIKNKKFYSIKQKEAKKIKRILKIPGRFNVVNALAALTVARVLKIPDRISFKVLSEYKGAWRRFEIKHTNLHKFGHKLARITIVSDYGHHPTKVRVTLKAAREKYPRKKIWLVYQPHQYQRTYYLFDDFVKVFQEALTKSHFPPCRKTASEASVRNRGCLKEGGRGKLGDRDFIKVFKNAPVDNLIITDIFDVAGRENKTIKKRVSSKKLVEAINNEKTLYIPTIEKAYEYLKKNLRGGEVVIIMGAGDIYKLVDYFTK